MTNGPKLLLFSHICSPVHITGAEKLLLLMLRELTPYFSCTLVVPGEGVLSEKARKRGIPVIVEPIPIYSSLYDSSPHLLEELEHGKQTREWIVLLQLLACMRPDAVLVNTCVHPLPAMAAKLLGIPVIWSITETIRQTPHTGQALSVIDSSSDRIIVLSQSTLAPLQRESLHAKAFMLPPAIDADALLPDTWPDNRRMRRIALGVSENQLLIGMIASNLYAGKGLEHFVLMAATIASRHPNAEFMVIGNPVDPNYFNDCYRIIKRSGIEDRFRWLNFEAQIEFAYPPLDVVVVPSLVTEGFGMTALEGMIFGKAVVAYASGGLAELMEATGNGALAAPAGDLSALTGRVSELLNYNRRLQAVSARNRGAAERAYGMNSYREKLEQFIGSLNLSPPAERLVRGSSPTYYRLRNLVLQPFENESAVLAAGHRLEEVSVLPDSVLLVLPHGEPIQDRRPFPNESSTKTPASTAAGSVSAQKKQRRRPREKRTAWGRNRRKGVIRRLRRRAAAAGARKAVRKRR